VLCEACVQNFQKIPFACSFLPGKSRVHMAWLAAGPLLFWVAMGVAQERTAFDHPAEYWKIVATLVAGAALARWNAERRARSDEAIMTFEESIPPLVQTLGLRFEPTTRQ
jgi:hypothetical protein